MVEMDMEDAWNQQIYSTDEGHSTTKGTGSLYPGRLACFSGLIAQMAASSQAIPPPSQQKFL